jgi:hypothetical protein
MRAWELLRLDHVVHFADSVARRAGQSAAGSKVPDFAVAFASTLAEKSGAGKVAKHMQEERNKVAGRAREHVGAEGHVGVDDLLNGVGLGSYVEAFDAEGFDCLQDLAAFSDAEFEECCATVGMQKRGHVMRLRRALRQL